MASDVQEIPVKTIKIAIDGLQTDEDGARAAGVLRGVEFVNTAVVLREKGRAIVTVPTAFSTFDSLEKALSGAGFAATLLDPVHLTLKVTKGDGVVDLPALANGFLTVKGAAATVPAASGDALAIYADPAQIDLAQLVKTAADQGYQAQVSSHEFVDVKIDAIDCKMKEQLVVSALTGLNGVIFASADSATHIARVLVAQGTTNAEGVLKALADAGYTGNWCPKGHTDCDDHKAKEGAEHPAQGEHPAKGEHPAGGEHPAKGEHPTGGEHPSKSEHPTGGDHPKGSEHPNGGEHPKK